MIIKSTKTLCVLVYRSLYLSGGLQEFDGDEAADDEQTLMEQEQHEEPDYEDELQDLRDEGKSCDSQALRSRTVHAVL